VKQFVEKRIQLACLNKDNPLPNLKKEYLVKLITDYKNDLRSIQLSLYDFFLEPKKEFYEL